MGGTSTESGDEIAVDAAGNVYTTGSFSSPTDFDPGAGVTLLTPNSSDIFVQKLDASGNLVWVIQIGDLGADAGYGISVDAQNNVYVTGTFKYVVDFDPGPSVANLTNPGPGYIDNTFILKLNSSGNYVWAKNISGGSNGINFGTKIQSDNAGNVYTQGIYYNDPDFNPGAATYNMLAIGTAANVYYLKLDVNGNFIWAKQVGTAFASTYCNDMKVMPSGDIYAIGDFSETGDFDPGAGVTTLTGGGTPNIFIQKLDTNGDLVFVKQIVGSTSLTGLSIDVDISGNIFTSGEFDGTIDFDPGAAYNGLGSFGGNAFVLKLDNVGNFVFVKKVSSAAYSFGNIVSFDSFGNIYIAGKFRGNGDFDSGAALHDLTSFNASIDVFVLKLSSVGNFMWVGQMGSIGDDDVLDMKVDAIGTIHLIGVYVATIDLDPNATSLDFTCNGSQDVFVVKLSQCQTTTNSFSATACDSYTYNSQTYTTSGSYNQTLINAGGCDSIITINLTITNSTANTISATACDSYTLNAQTYTSSGTYTQGLTNAANCDSVLTINLTILNSTTNTISATACDSYTLNAQTYTSSGTYTQSLTNAANCDSTLTINLTINTVDISVTTGNATFMANSAIGAYQWLDCNNGYAIISGETNQFFTPSNNGYYAVMITDNGCVDTSVCVNIFSVGIEEINELSVDIYPNPFNSQTTISFRAEQNNMTIIITDAVGKEIKTINFTGKELLITKDEMNEGIYFVQIINEKKNISNRKIVIQ